MAHTTPRYFSEDTKEKEKRNISVLHYSIESMTTKQELSFADLIFCSYILWVANQERLNYNLYQCQMHYKPNIELALTRYRTLKGV